MTTLHTSQALPQMVSETLTHLREGYDFLAGEMSHAMALIDCGTPELAHAVRSIVPNRDGGLDLR